MSTFGSSLQPQQRLVLDGPVPAVGVEDSFLSFEDVQRRTAEPAALQRGEEGLGVEQRAAPGVDDERAVLHLLDASAIEEMVRVRVERRVERDDVALLQQFVERNVVGGGLRPAVVGQDRGSRIPAAGP